MLMPSWPNSTGRSPYSFSKAHLAPLDSANHHSASRTLTTNQPSVTGASPDPESSSRASATTRILAAQCLCLPVFETLPDRLHGGRPEPAFVFRGPLIETSE